MNNNPALQKYLAFERSSLWTALGHFNLAIGLFYLPWLCVSFFLPGPCHSVDLFPAVHTPVLFLSRLWLICCGIECFRRTRHFATAEIKRCLWDTIIQNLPGVFFALICLAQSPWLLLYMVYLSAFFVSVYFSGKRLIQRQNQAGLSPKIQQAWQTLFSRRRLWPYLVYYLSLLPLSLLLNQLSHVGPGDCGSTLSHIKANMHTLESMVEQYREAHGGHIPADLMVLQQDARQNTYWKVATNPFAGNHACVFFLNRGCWLGYYSSYLDLQRKGFPRQHRLDDWLGLPLDIGPATPRYWMGLVLYDASTPTRYFIYGTDKFGQIIRDKGQDLALSNG